MRPGQENGGMDYVIVNSAVLADLRHVTDRQTDGRTQGVSIYRASIVSHGNSLRPVDERDLSLSLFVLIVLMAVVQSI